MPRIERFLLEEQRNRDSMAYARGEEWRGLRPTQPGDHQRLGEIRERALESGSGIEPEYGVHPAIAHASVQRGAHLPVKGRHEDVHDRCLGRPDSQIKGSGSRRHSGRGAGTEWDRQLIDGRTAAARKEQRLAGSLTLDAPE